MSTLCFPYYLTTTQGCASRISTTNPNSMKYRVRFHIEFLYSQTGEWFPWFIYAEQHQYQQRNFCFIHLHSKKIKCEYQVRSTDQGRSREREQIHNSQTWGVQLQQQRPYSLSPSHISGVLSTALDFLEGRNKFHSCLFTFFIAMLIMNSHQCHSYEAWNVKRYIGINQGYNFIYFSEILFLKVYQYTFYYEPNESLNSV